MQMHNIFENAFLPSSLDYEIRKKTIQWHLLHKPQPEQVELVQRLAVVSLSFEPGPW
jgi:hypothetical protein